VSVGHKHRQETISVCDQLPRSTQLLVLAEGKMSTVSVSGLRSKKLAMMDVDTLAGYTGGLVVRHNWLGPNTHLICIHQLHQLNSCAITLQQH